MTGRDITISELFGPTHQGEGPSAGRLTLFVRLGLCNLDCAWCDTPFTWDWTGKNGKVYDKSKELTRMPVSEVVDWVQRNSVGRVVVSGGEPTVQMSALSQLLIELDNIDQRIEVETNGTRFPEGLPVTLLRTVQWNVSPKLSSSGVDPDKAFNWDVLKQYARYDNANLKLVVANQADAEQASSVVANTRWPRDRVYLMPEGIDADTINDNLEGVMSFAMNQGVNVTSRLHVLAYGDRRGV